MIEHYHHVVDALDWDALYEVFAPDAVFDGTTGSVTGIPAIARLLDAAMTRSGRRPVAHLGSNVVVRQYLPNQVVVSSKYLAVMSDGSVAAGRYLDQVMRKPGGEWRLSRRVAERTADPTMVVP